MRYRYRIEPTPAQQAMLARVFGCARVVFNDALRVRGEAYQAGIKMSDSEIQRRVITQAKTTEERGWLCEVPSVALVQSVNDSRRAWRNFFDSAAGKRKGRRVGRPRMKSRKDRRQSFRLTRNGFAVRDNGRLFVADADPKKFTLRGKTEQVFAGSQNWATPVLVDGRLYVRNHEDVKCFDVR